MALTDAKIRNAKPTPKRYKLADGQGLYVEVMPSGTKFFRIKYRNSTDVRRTYTPGEYPHLGLAEARARLAEVKQAVREGGDPAQEARAVPVAEEVVVEEAVVTFGEVGRAYIAKRGKEGVAKLRSERNKRLIHNQMHKHLKKWLRVPLDEITKADCVKAHAAASETGGAGANHVLRSFRSIYNHARRTHDLPESPTIAIEWNAEAPSMKIIDDLDQWKSEVAALKNPVHQAYYRFLLFTGLRREEARSLRWDQVFDDHLHLGQRYESR
jgi:hypothetical protein